MTLKRKGLAFLALIFSVGLSATPFDEMNNIIQNINATFSGFYAPKQWKEKTFQWDLPTQVDKLRMCALDNELEAFHQGLKRFFQSTRDYHTSVWFANNASSMLPISIKYIDGGFYLAHVDSIIANNFPLLVGDKIISLGGRDVSELTYELMGKLENPSLTDWSLAAKKLTKRLGTAGDVVEKGSVVIEALRGEQKVFAQVVWISQPNTVKTDKENPALAKKEQRQLRADLPAQHKEILNKILDHIESRSHHLPYADFLRQLPEESPLDPLALAKKESYLPSLGHKEVWRSGADNLFQAYIYLNEENKLVGFIRIPSFMPDKNLGTPEKFAEEFGKIIAEMEDKAELLIIDQLNNPGGSIFYLYAIASMLTDRPLKNPHHRFMIDSQDIYEAQNQVKQIDMLIALSSLMNTPLGTIHGYPIDGLFLLHMKSYYQFVIEQGKALKTLSDPYFLFGVDYIQPHPLYRFTKKIVILTNELDFSAGDFFPAIFQDSKRAIILGTTTAGAGGYVLKNKERNRAYVLNYSYTGSLAYRANGQPLENIGVIPDISYQISQADLRSQFYFFRSAIEAVVKEELKGEVLKAPPPRLL